MAQRALARGSSGLQNLKGQNPGMCKTSNRKEADLPPLPPMLMPNELPNWLLFRALEARNLPPGIARQILIARDYSPRQQFHKLFHSTLHRRQLESPKPLTIQIYRDSCNPNYSDSRTPLDRKSSGPAPKRRKSAAQSASPGSKAEFIPRRLRPEDRDGNPA
jgi:hypothetical protein